VPAWINEVTVCYVSSTFCVYCELHYSSSLLFSDGTRIGTFVFRKKALAKLISVCFTVGLRITKIQTGTSAFFLAKDVNKNSFLAISHRVRKASVNDDFAPDGADRWIEPTIRSDFIGISSSRVHCADRRLIVRVLKQLHGRIYYPADKCLPFRPTPIDKHACEVINRLLLHRSAAVREYQ